MPSHLAERAVLCLCLPVILAATAGAASLPGQCMEPGLAADAARTNAMMGVLVDRDRGDSTRLSATLADLEAAHGPVHPQLFPVLLALGLAQQEEGNAPAAASSLRRALFIVRAADGLYSLDQVPVIDVLIEAYVAAGDWHRASDAVDLLEWVYRRNFAADDPRMLPVLDRLRTWHIEVYNKDDGRDLEMHYAVVERAYVEALTILDRCTGDHRLSLCHFHAGCCPGADADAGACPDGKSLNFSAGYQSN